MAQGNLKLALSAIRASRWRSLMTMFGIIIGVVSVVTTISIGEGIKRQVAGQLQHAGHDLITVRPGKKVNRSTGGEITGINFLSNLGGSTLTEQDLQIIQKTPNVEIAVPLSLITGVASFENRDLTDGLIVATTVGLPEILDQPIEFGGFFSKDETDKPIAVLGKYVAERLFQENVPIGKSLVIRGQEFIVRGIFEEFETAPILGTTDLNSAIFIPYGAGKGVLKGTTQIYQVLVKPADATLVVATISLMREALLNAHAGQEDFTILRQSESLELSTSILNLITALIAGIASISLLVGGIGIMNIMLASVSERTREIGIRKAIGATNSQILTQFLVESTVLSLWGGIIGVIMSILANFGIRIVTDLQPVITWPVVALAVTTSIIIGVIFGIAPAMMAARKDPIEALRT